VKYSVVNQENDDGDFSAIPVNRIVHSGNNVVAILAVLVYALKILVPKLSSVAAYHSNVNQYMIVS